MKKLITCLLALILVFSGLGLNKVNAAQFSDVPTTHGFYNEITYLLGKGVISSGSKYGVNDKISRADVAVMVSKAIGLDGIKTNTQFKDVTANHAASGYINSAVKAGVIKGFSDGTFRPNGLVDRGEMAIFLARAFELEVESSAEFKDMTPSMASYASIKKIVNAKITTGFSNNTFRPSEKLTRGQISAFLARAMQIGSTITPTPTPTPTPVTPTPVPNPGPGTYVIPGAPTSFQNCTEMKSYYPKGVKSGHPAYESKHDRDKDRWACE